MLNSIGANTDEPSLSDQVHRFKPKVFRDRTRLTESSKGLACPDRYLTSNLSINSSQSVDPLSTKCVEAVINNFAAFPVHEGIPARHMREITKGLSENLDADIAAEFIFDENYWKRRCTEQILQRNCQISDHGLMWKQLFLEEYVQKSLEDYEPNSTFSTMESLLRTINLCQDYIFSLKIRQLLAHPDIEKLFLSLPNLTKLDLTYGVKKIGMKYDRLLFGMKISDANCLAKSFHHSDNLTSLVLQSNLIDDDLLRMLMTGLVKNTQITHLDLSHNKITNHGVRLLSKLLGESSVLTSLNLADNQIHAEGGRYLGRALRCNDSLIHLNLRLNRLVDDGGRMLLEGLRNNTTVTNLNLSANSLGSESSSSLAVILEGKTSKLQSLDLSCNKLTEKDIEELTHVINSNLVVCNFDLRMNLINDGHELLAMLNAAIHRNELNSQKSKS